MGEDRKDELKVLVKIAGLLDALDPAERERVLQYLNERYQYEADEK